MQLNEVRSRQEENANRFTLKCMVLLLFGLFLCWFLNIVNIFVVDMKLMNRALLGSLFIIIALMIAHFVDLKSRWLKYVLIFAMMGAITVDGIAMTYHMTLLSVLPLFLSIQYSSKKTVIYTYVLSVISVAIIVIIGYFYGLCDANMLLLTTGQMREYVDMTTGAVSFPVVNERPWITLPLYYIFPRSLLLFLLVPVMNKISNGISNTAVELAHVQKEAEQDSMTGIYNRNKYLQMVKSFYENIPMVGVIFWDINDLKKMNDVYGHTNGDYMIISVANRLKELSADNRKLYRIGGDEFIMIVENPEKEALERIINEWNSKGPMYHSDDNQTITAAIGYAYGEGKRIKEIVDKADHDMYMNKKNMKNVSEKVQV
ncbi:MAG: GGDEF domain-containing protein [Lachnospiraceae bacterium]|nr:GGDEF domain-containing protein [Lachnospiraceae bacterium]